MNDAIKHGIVKTTTNGIQISRSGRGYSKNELVHSGVTDIRIARQYEVSIDPFRTSVYQENIEQLKAFLSQQTSKSDNVKQKGLQKKQSKNLKSN
jgi:ribosomal protein L13E